MCDTSVCYIPSTAGNRSFDLCRPTQPLCVVPEPSEPDWSEMRWTRSITYLLGDHSLMRQKQRS